MKLNSKAVRNSGNDEVGTPYFLYDPGDNKTASRSRVMPSQFSFPMLPMACTFIRNLNLRDL